MSKPAPLTPSSPSEERSPIAMRLLTCGGSVRFPCGGHCDRSARLGQNRTVQSSTKDWSWGFTPSRLVLEQDLRSA
jgi:hypothetical protein